jgi:hypothetical protein
MHVERIGGQQEPTVTNRSAVDCVSTGTTSGDFRFECVEVPGAKRAISYVSNTPIDYMRESLLRIDCIIREQANWEAKKGVDLTHLEVKQEWPFLLPASAVALVFGVDGCIPGRQQTPDRVLFSEAHSRLPSFLPVLSFRFGLWIVGFGSAENALQFRRRNQDAP